MKKKNYFLLMLFINVYYLQAQNLLTKNKDSIYNKKLLKYNPLNLKEKKWAVEIDFNKLAAKVVITKPIIIEVGVTQFNPKNNVENKISFFTFSSNATDINTLQNNIEQKHNFFIFYTGLENRKYFKNSNFYYSKIVGFQLTSYDNFFEKGYNKYENTNFENKNEFNILLGGGIGFKKRIKKSNFTWGAEVKLGYFILPKNLNEGFNFFPLFHTSPFYVDLEYLRFGYIFK